MLVCGICKGKKIIESYGGKPKICPKCKGSGNLEEQTIDNNKKPKKVLNG